MTIQQYIDNLNQRYQLGNATEHTFRGDLQQLIESLVPDIRATNEPKRQSCGAPDYILTKKDIPIGYIETKDIGYNDLAGEKKTGNKEQFDRYKASLNNLFFTDYINFYLYREGQFVTKIAIAELTTPPVGHPSKVGEIKPLTENFESFERLLKDFCTHISLTIKSPTKLAQMMASKARLLSEIIEKALTSDETHNEDSTLKDQMNAFKLILIHDIKPKDFADVYAQTIVYGMFAARYHDPTLPTFSRQEAYELIPKSNPFLKKLFGYIAGLDVDDRIKWIVDDLIHIFLACNVEEMLKNYGKSTQTEDPIIHFYEDFLSEYDPKLRKARGVWYTPAPVVNFIVRAVDDILKTDFDLPNGLADTSKITNPLPSSGGMPNRWGGQDVHKVQILDPATGTGTFLAEVVKQIHKNFEGQQGIWNSYVEKELLPRLTGFELLMASYAMAHLKLDMLLTETGYKPTSNQRLKIYLTNSLEEHHPDTETLFASWLSAEANEANQIKRDAPVMCIIGNPPYSCESANKGEWIRNLMMDYKKEPGGKEKLKERNPKMINDDYVKFLRLGQDFIEKNGSGILAYINPHGFLDNPTFRGMRWNLLNTYDKIFTIDLHGNSRKNEVSLDGSIDQNVFDIMQGVSINFLVKTGKKKTNELGKVFHFELFGKREAKYHFLLNNKIENIDYKELNNVAPNYFFTPKLYNIKNKYDEGFKINECFSEYSVGITTSNDTVLINKSRSELIKNVNDYYKTESDSSKIENFPYRPFDNQFVYFDSKKIGRSREKIMKHFIKQKNIGLIFEKIVAISKPTYSDIFVTNTIIDKHTIGGASYLTPLYLYPPNNESDQSEYRANLELRLEEAKATYESLKKSFAQIKKMYEAFPNPDEDTKKFYKEEEKNYKKYADKVQRLENELSAGTSQTIFKDEGRKPNLNPEIVKQIADSLGLSFTNEKEITHNTFAPIDILDYIYAVLHSPSYREKYNEFLKIDFPRVPFPKNAETFWKMVKLGGEIRQIHLLESPIIEKHITNYPVHGENVVSKIKYEDRKVYINDNQYFDNVPVLAWNFFIGGYQPAQKWLKDRKDRALDFDDILHYQKIIVALTETDRLMKEIDIVGVE